MRYFLPLASGLDVTPLLLALAHQPFLWNACTLRTATPDSPHAEASDILLRLQPLDGRSTDHRECIWYSALHALPQARPLIYGLAARVEADRIGRVMITRLPPGGHIPAHADVGTHPMHYDTIHYYDRYHVVLQADEGSVFACGDEQVHMPTGTCWWFDNATTHEVWNTGHVDRLHLIIDLRTAQSVPL